MDEVVVEFLTESAELLDLLERNLIDVDTSPGADQGKVVAETFRVFHTFKGTSAFLGFERVKTLAHAAEDLLAAIREGSVRWTDDVTDLLLAVLDGLRTMVAEAHRSGTDGQESYPALVQRLRAATEVTAAPPAPAAPVAGPASAPASSAPASSAPAPEATGASGAPVPVFKPRAPAPVRTAPVARKPVPAPAPPAAAEPPAVRTPSPTEGGAETASTLRVPVTVLDQLMNLVGELVLARNQLLTQEATREDPQLTATSQRIHQLTAGLQDAVMKARMQPIDAVFSRLPRVARDAAHALGKQARLVTSGQDTELDKALLEAIKDPLTHVVRNAVDHGLEKPDGRAAAGKPAEGTVAVRAFQEGSQVVVEVEDDGRGVDVQRVRAKAVASGLVTPEAAAQLADADVIELLFRAGFSTAEAVTAISGRGVGMDVVRTNVERIGGTVQLLSRPGRGSLIRMRVPLTLVIVPALVVSSGGERYAIPQANLVELLHISPDREGKLLADVHGTRILRLRGALLPVVDLAGLLRTGAAARAPDGGFSAVVLASSGRRLALLVDEVLDTEDIVVKPLARRLEALGVYAGATVRGDGRVAMVLDVAGLARRTGISGEAERHAEEAAAELAGQRQGRYLLLRGADDGRLAFPLGQISRVEELPAARVEPVGGGEAIQYRGGVLPLLRLSEALVERRRRPRGPRAPAGDSIHVVVRPWDGREVGIVVDDVLDVVETDAPIDPTGARPGVSGCALIQGRITEVLDPQVLLVGRLSPAAQEVTP